MITVLDCLESTAAKFAANIICSDAKKQITYTDFVKMPGLSAVSCVNTKKCANLWLSLWITL